MEWLAGIFYIVIGGIILMKPKVMWRMADSWNSKTIAEPANFYFILIRAGGCILVIGGIVAFFQR